MPIANERTRVYNVNMKCHFEDCKNKVEDPNRSDWYGLCDKHVAQEVQEQKAITEHFRKLGNKSWESRKKKILNETTN